MRDGNYRIGRVIEICQIGLHKVLTIFVVNSLNLLLTIMM